MIEFKKVCKTYISKKSSNTVALDDISFKLPDKGLVFILGKSGCGKSTLLNLLGGLDVVTSGTITVNGKDITTLTDKEYDSYRNSIIGIVFQEFNLLDELTVYENISLAIELQNKNALDADIKELLEKLDLKGLEHRKINELSGGQKQRVAIARAIIKKPRILLCDEPTGNLDSKSSKQTFEILKEISKDILVVVVSHDRESAEKYNDDIIELADGKIISNSIKRINDTSENLELINSKLPLKYACRIGQKGLLRHPIKLFMTILITSIALLFMGVALNITLFDQEKFVLDTMEATDSYRYSIKRFQKVQIAYNEKKLTEEDYAYIESVVGKNKINRVYSLISPDDVSPFGFNYNDDEHIKKIQEEELKFIYKKYYFHNFLESNNFVELTDEKLVGKVIGKIPTNEQEILIHKYMAEYIIKFGIYDYDGVLYKPTSIEQIIKDARPLRIGSYQVYISGIIDDENKYGKYAQDEIFNEWEFHENFMQTFSNLGDYIYVKGFANNYQMTNDEINIQETFSIYMERTDSESKWQLLSKEIEYISADGIKKVSELAKDEVIVTLNTLKIIDYELYEEIDKFSQNHKNLSLQEIEKLFITEYLANNTLEGKLSYGMDLDKNFDEVKIIGVSLDEYNYASYTYKKAYDIIDKNVVGIIMYEDDLDELKRIISNFEIYKAGNSLEEFLMFEPPYNISIETVIDIHYFVRNIALFITLLFTLFALFVFTNFISVTITYSRKKIGILKALGASSKDVLGIFGYEAILTGVISWVFGMIFTFIANGVLSDMIEQEIRVVVTVISTHYLTPILMLLYTILLALIITTISISYVSRVKPIDSILEK